MMGDTDTNIRHSPVARSAYHYNHHIEFIFSFAAFLLVLLAFFEPPSWCVYRKGFDKCTTIPDSFRTFDLVVFDLTTSFSIEFVLLSLITFEFLLKMFIQGSSFWRLLRNRVLVALLIGCAIDFVASIVVAGMGNIPWIRFAPYLRLLLFGVRSWMVRRQLLLFVTLIGKFLAVMVVMGVQVLMFGLFLTVLVPKSIAGGKSEFEEFKQSTWNLYIIATTANFDDQMQDDVEKYMFYFFFSLIYVIIIILFMYNLVVAVVYKTYMDGQEAQFKKDRHQMMVVQQKVWDEIDQEKKGAISHQDILLLLKEARKYQYFRRIIYENEFEMTIWALDKDNDGIIDQENFKDLIAVLRLGFERLDSPTFMKIRFPSAAGSKVFKDFCRFTRSLWFEGIVWVGLAGVAIYTFANFWIILNEFDDIKFDDEIEVTIALFFLIEAIIRVFALGWKKYWRLHSFDFWIMVVSLFPIVSIFLKKLRDVTLGTTNMLDQSIDFLDTFYSLQIPGVLRIARLVLTIPWFKMFHQTTIKMVQASIKLLNLLFCFLCFFSLLGCQLFGGNRKEERDTDFTMNDPLGAILNMVELIETQEIFVQYKTYSQFDGRKLSGLFFAISFSIIVVICLNLVLSYVIDIFNEEFDREAHNLRQMRQVTDVPIQIIGPKVFFKGYCIKNLTGGHSDYGEDEGAYCASLRKWAWQKERGGLDQEDEMINLFQEKANVANSAVL